MMVASNMHPRPVAPLSKPSRLVHETRRVWVILCLTVKRFLRIDGAQWAGAFAFNAFFSLFPFPTLNAVYGAFGGMMALLLWIYLSGCVFIFGACLCAGQAEALAAGRLSGRFETTKASRQP